MGRYSYLRNEAIIKIKKTLFLTLANTILRQPVCLLCRLVASVADEGRGNTQDNYSNPRCACAPRVIILESFDLLFTSQYHNSMCMCLCYWFSMILSINMYKGEAYEVNVHGGCMKYVLAKKKAKSSEVR